MLFIGLYIADRLASSTLDNWYSMVVGGDKKISNITN